MRLIYYWDFFFGGIVGNEQIDITILQIVLFGIFGNAWHENGRRVIRVSCRESLDQYLAILRELPPLLTLWQNIKQAYILLVGDLVVLIIPSKSMMDMVHIVNMSMIILKATKQDHSNIEKFHYIASLKAIFFS